MRKGLLPTTSERSALMSRVRSSGNKSTEMAMVALLRAYGLSGWRRHLLLPGRPDFVFRNERVVIFVDGCFWHGCPRCYTRPRSNAEFWNSKVQANITRDRRVARTLRKDGWCVIRVWEHSLKKAKHDVASRIMRYLDR